MQKSRPFAGAAFVVLELSVSAELLVFDAQLDRIEGRVAGEVVVALHVDQQLDRLIPLRQVMSRVLELAERLDQVESILETGGKLAISLVLHLIETAPRDRDGWLSYLLTGPIDDLWRRSDLDQHALVEASAQSDELAEALSYLTDTTPNEPAPTTRRAKRPSKRQGNRPRHS